ncbi:transmembrane family 220 protein [Pontibacter ummariensis]|uniref:Transmembrane family 220, helix n=1 Tax=Pontibacter ummariensis TaxID=1610492 RepID=A0A239GDS5_9BACT|nr:transmembrane 220 family protein [Pontibacter ummariensis]PRY11217.1 transmembrane family 220 protein [Pontibacter ummariensis]SNS67289.1 Transmembrane family 220, helix [Pontibacter ummariensis]
MALKKILAVCFGIAFLTFVVVQYNDPDPVIWMAVYGMAALLSFAAAFNKANDTLLGIAAALYAAGGVYMWPNMYEGITIGDGDIRNIEEARESFGLFLCTIAFSSYILLNLYDRRLKRKAQLKQKARWTS